MEQGGKRIDPRVRRTRRLLQDALEKLLETTSFEELSVQDITEMATVNRATFYDHYPDKFALLECCMARRFEELLVKRAVNFNGGCLASVKAIVLGVGDFLTGVSGSSGESPRRLEPHLESAVIAVIGAMLLAGLKRHPPVGSGSLEMRAAAASWAIYGGAKQWLLAVPGGSSGEEAADEIVRLVSPILIDPALAASAES